MTAVRKRRPDGTTRSAVPRPRRIEVCYQPTRSTARHVGSLALDRGEPVFEFARAWLDDPLPLAPRTLIPAAGLFRGPEGMPDRLHGLFADSLPDAWGHLLADRHFAAAGVAREEITLLDRLAHVGNRGMGALTYEPADESGRPSFTPDLDSLADEANRVLEGSSTDVLTMLIAAAGPSGGARPKVLIGIGPDGSMFANSPTLPAGYEAFIVKFSAHTDPPDAGPVEYAYSRMAAAAGVRLDDTRLVAGKRGTRYFATRRFDRGSDGLRIHMLTASGMLDIDPRYYALEYSELGAEIARVCEDYGEGREFARRMVFNVLAHNRDDHLKNTALLMDSAGQWKLAPAYDLMPMAGPGGEHSMLIDGEGRSPTAADLVAAGDAMGVEAGPMKAIIAEVDGAVARWSDFAEEAGVRAERRAEIAQLLENARRGIRKRSH